LSAVFVLLQQEIAKALFKAVNRLESLLLSSISGQAGSLFGLERF